MSRSLKHLPILIPFYDIPLQYDGDNNCPHELARNNTRGLSTITEEIEEEKEVFDAALLNDIYDEEIFNKSRNKSFSEAKWSLPPEAPPDFNKRRIVFCHQNVNSVRNKLDEIKSVLMYDRIAVLVCTESKLDPDRDTDNMYIIQGYHMIRNDRKEDQGGGTLIYISDKYDYEVIDFEVSNSKIEIYLVKIRRKGIAPILVVSVYRPPNTCIKEFLKIFRQLNSKLVFEKCEKVMMGHFKAC